MDKTIGPEQLLKLKNDITFCRNGRTLQIAEGITAWEIVDTCLKLQIERDRFKSQLDLLLSVAKRIIHQYPPSYFNELTGELNETVKGIW